MIFKNGKQFDAWQCSALAQARTQDVADILDSSYPPSPVEKDSFTEKQKYMFAFDKILLTDVGKFFIQVHENNANAQAVYKAVVEYYFKSTKASLDSADLLFYITSIYLVSGL